MKEWAWGAVGAVATAIVLGLVNWLTDTTSAGIDAAAEAQMKQVIEANRVLSPEEAQTLKNDVSAMKGELKTLNATNTAILNAILDD